MGQRQLRWCGAAALSCAAAWSATAWGQESGQGVAPQTPVAAAPTPRVTNVFLQTPLREALEDLAAQSGVPIVIGPEIGAPRDVEFSAFGGDLVTLEFNNTPLPQALDMLLAQGGYVWRQKDGYILVGSPAPDSPLFLELSETRDFKLQNLTAAEALASLAPTLQPYVTANEKMNRLAVTAPPSIMTRIAADIDRIDEPVRHVLLEGRVVVLERDALLDIGVEWDFPTIQAGTFTSSEHNGEFPWLFEVGLTPGFDFTNSLLLTLNLLEQNDEAAIVSNPQLMVRDAEAATMGVTNEEYFLVATELIGDLASDVELEKITAGTTLAILPRITGDNEITLEMDIEVSNVVARGANNLPIVTRRTAQSIVKLRSGGTAAIAGLTDTRFEQLDRRVPGASNLPGLGRLFRSDSNDEQSRQLAVFITATIVEDATSQSRFADRQTAAALVDEEAFREALRDAIQRLESEQGVTR